MDNNNNNNLVMTEELNKLIVDKDPFDGSSGPTIFMSENRMPVLIEFNNILIYIFFSSLILALLFILPGIREKKLTTFICLATILSLGATILLALEGSNWLTGVLNINKSQYSSLTSELINGKIEINVGLKSVNVTLIGKLIDDNEQQRNKQLFIYNERFYLNEPDKMLDEHYKALKKGLPYPILTITEFLSQDSDGFNWSRHLRLAGYYCSLILYLTLAIWLLMCLILCVLPIYLPYLMLLNGLLLITTVWIYTILIESPKIYSIQFNGIPLELSFGFTYVLTFISGSMSIFVGLIIMAIQTNDLSSDDNQQFTIMDLESYVNDKKALSNLNNYKNFKINNNNNNLELQKKKNKNATVEFFNNSKNVIIPMDDIEEKFNINMKS